MPLEIEYKTRVDSHVPVAAALASAEARCVSAVLEINRLYDRSDHSLHMRGCGLRVRSVRPLATTPDTAGPDAAASPVTLTFKGPVQAGAFKSREEIEFTAGDADAAARMLEALGFHLRLLHEKIRMSYVLEDCRVDLDELPRLGFFVEIEGPEERAIHRVRDRLNLSAAPSIRTSYAELIAEAFPSPDERPIVLRFV